MLGNDFTLRCLSRRQSMCSLQLGGWDGWGLVFLVDGALFFFWEWVRDLQSSCFSHLDPVLNSRWIFCCCCYYFSSCLKGNWLWQRKKRRKWVCTPSTWTQPTPTSLLWEAEISLSGESVLEAHLVPPRALRSDVPCRNACGLAH